MFRSPTARLVALALGVLLALPAAAQWAWRDENGRLVYSDRAPPPSVKAEQIVRQPATPGAVAAPAARTSGPPPASSAATTSLAERELESRRRQQEAEQAAKKAEQQQAHNSQVAAECDRSRGYLRALEDGIRVVRTDPQGNREYLTDEQRAAEIKRTREAIDKLCKS
jgi:hypothetical protein